MRVESVLNFQPVLSVTEVFLMVLYYRIDEKAD